MTSLWTRLMCVSSWPTSSTSLATLWNTSARPFCPSADPSPASCSSSWRSCPVSGVGVTLWAESCFHVSNSPLTICYMPSENYFHNGSRDIRVDKSTVTTICAYNIHIMQVI